MQPFALDLSRAALKLRRTKIVATLGKSSSSPEVVSGLVDAGVDVFRLNFSHGTHESHAALYAAIRQAEAAAGRHIAVLADLCGPKIRVGRFFGGSILLEEGAEVTVTVRPVEGRPGLIPSEYTPLARDVAPGDRILLDDGKLELTVISVVAEDVRCRVIQGGPLSDRKGMNLPGVRVSAPALTEKDRHDAAFAANLGVDWIALSFVRQKADILELREWLRGHGKRTPIIAKIEKPEAVADIGPIVEAADGLMIARGDLGVEMPCEEVPLIQHQLIQLGKRARRPVIVATQMLESMIENPRPTRAEVSDVASAAFAGTDAVMLSGETAAGEHPIEAVRAMDRILRLVEGYQWKHGQFGSVGESSPIDCASGDALTSALSRATSQISRDLSVRAIVVPTRGGSTARTVAAVRPAAPIVAATASESVARQLALCWGLLPKKLDEIELSEPTTFARKLVRDLGLAEPGQLFLLVWDTSRDRAGTAPTVTILGA